MLRSRATTASTKNDDSTISRTRRQYVISRNRKRLQTRRTSAASIPPPLTILLAIVLLGISILEFVYLSSLDDSNGRQLWMSITQTFLRPTLQQGQKANLQNGASDSPIDDYYDRPHIRKTPVPIIVGGSDGSGTRVFVQVLQELGVDMIVEDEGTMDIHGLQLYGGEGWPGLVSRVFQATHSAVYELEDLPETLRTTAFADIGQMLSNMEASAEIMRRLKRSNAAKSGKNQATSDISFGFKAPVTMLLLPFFRNQLPVFKFLHVVRDGRDVAFSNNQSPVEKFYDTYYLDAGGRDYAMLNQDFGFHTRKTIKAMQLWNDWNKLVYEYEMNAADGQTFDVLVMRSEDLIHQKYEALLKLADFVGSTLSKQEICCLSRKATIDIGNVAVSGKHDATKDFDALGGKFNGMDSGSMGEFSGRSSHIQLRWADTGSWVSIPQKMMNQHRNDSANTRRRLTEMLGRPGENLKTLRVDMVDAMSRFTSRLSRSIDQTPAQVESRYGKWRQKLANNPELRDVLFWDGREALRIFGYEPPRKFMDSTSIEQPICDESVNCLQKK
ncbi:hypothetical protein IV203_026430 [Nitzschia inconspicua]|uniref:Sulfotransferase n=1 Tax=Nitzschia inconspicua TaxID=303405 RepID=A0A9K3PXD5_9STRA|nr:hypothetical protein IV203_026430 [Nitzschia inconspicua]